MAALPFDLTGQVAVVTGGGANGGIGHAIARSLALAGADLLIVDRDGASAEATVREVRDLGREATAVTCDLGEIDQIDTMYQALDDTFGRIDILVNNAATGIRTLPEKTTVAEYEAVMKINLVGTFRCTQLAGQRMIASGRGGSIVNIASIAGASALGRGNFAYSVSKGGLLQMTRELAIEWARHNIRVNAILPSQTLSASMRDFLANPIANGPRLKAEFLRGIPLNRLAEPDNIAWPVVFLASPAASFVTGVLLPVDGGNLAMNAGGTPRWAVDDAGNFIWEDA